MTVFGTDVTKQKSEKVPEISSALGLSTECLVTALPSAGRQHPRDQQEETLVCKVQPRMTAAKSTQRETDV